MTSIDNFFFKIVVSTFRSSSFCSSFVFSVYASINKFKKSFFEPFKKTKRLLKDFKLSL